MTSTDARAILAEGIEPRIAALARPVLWKRAAELIFFPSMWIPSYNLAEVRRLIEPRLPRAVVGRSYLAFVGRFIAATFRRQRPGVIGLVGPSGGTS